MRLRHWTFRLPRTFGRPLAIHAAMLAIGLAGCLGGDDPDPTCGDGLCSARESALTCPADCHSSGAFCGDGSCGVGETASSCPADCASSGGPVCGDRVCNGAETSGTCPSDCAAAACTVSNPSSCAGETLCLGGVCVNAFGRAYTIVAVGAVVPQFKPNQDTWDAAGGAPDPYAVISLNGQVLLTTPHVQDNFTPVWNAATAPTVIAAGSSLRVDVYDKDITTDDGILFCTAAPLTADLLHLGEVRCDGTFGQLTIRVSTR